MNKFAVFFSAAVVFTTAAQANSWEKKYSGPDCKERVCVLKAYQSYRVQVQNATFTFDGNDCVGPSEPSIVKMLDDAGMNAVKCVAKAGSGRQGFLFFVHRKDDNLFIGSGTRLADTIAQAKGVLARVDKFQGEDKF